MPFLVPISSHSTSSPKGGKGGVDHPNGTRCLLFPVCWDVLDLFSCDLEATCIVVSFVKCFWVLFIEY